MKLEIGIIMETSYNRAQIIEWLKEYGLHHFLQYPYKPQTGMHVGHMIRYPEDLAEFLVEKLNRRG